MTPRDYKRATLVICAFLIATFAFSCDRGKTPGASSTTQPQTSAPDQYDALAKSLASLRRGISQIPEADPAAFGRIDHVIAILKDESALARHAYLTTAVVVNDTSITGADLLHVKGVARLGQISSINFTDGAGYVVAERRDPGVYWGPKDTTGTVGCFEVVIYVAPSVYDPPSATPSPGVENGSMIGDPHNFKYGVVKLPAGTSATDLTIRVVFADGRETDAVKAWKDRSGIQTDSPSR